MATNEGASDDGMFDCLLEANIAIQSTVFCEMLQALLSHTDQQFGVEHWPVERRRQWMRARGFAKAAHTVLSDAVGAWSPPGRELPGGRGRLDHLFPADGNET